MATFTKRVLASVDDGSYNAGFDPAWEYTGVGISTGKSGFPTNQNFILGVRFNSVSIPQGATVSSAKITFRAIVNDSNNVLTKIYGIDEDDTADFSTDPTGRTKTTAAVDWDLNGVTSGNNYDTAAITSIVQEIVDRGGWSSGNDMGFLIYNDGSGDGVNHAWRAYDGDSGTAALLTVVYIGISPSASLSPSASSSASASASASRSGSLSDSPSPSPILPFFGLKIAKAGKDVLKTDYPPDLIFSSDYGTLKYYSKQTASFNFDANAGLIGGTTTITHGLNYYPFVEVFARVYIGAPAGNYEYCPFFGAGATILYSANYKITPTQIVLYGEIDGVSGSVWNFDFLVFIFKNDLQL